MFMNKVHPSGVTDWIDLMNGHSELPGSCLDAPRDIHFVNCGSLSSAPLFSILVDGHFGLIIATMCSTMVFKTVPLLSGGLDGRFLRSNRIFV